MGSCHYERKKSDLERIMKYFEYDHLPEGFWPVLEPYYDMAHMLLDYYNKEYFVIDEAEMYDGVRKLMESREAIIRARGL